MRKNCPHCERPTYVPTRVGNDRIKPANIGPGVLMASTSDGTCNACWRLLKGKPRLSTKGTTLKNEVVYRHTMSEAEIRAAREQLVKLWAGRRQRGVHPEGRDPATLHRPGLTLMEV